MVCVIQYPELRLFVWELALLQRHSNDLRGSIIEAEAFAKDVGRAAESALPITVAQDDEVFAELAVPGQESSPNNRLNPHHREKICADDGRLNPLSLIAF